MNTYKLPSNKKLLLLLSVIFILFAHLVFGGDVAISQFLLPFKDKDARYFFEYNDSLYFGDHPNRTLYKLTAGDTLEKTEDMKGWAIMDAWPFQQRIYYCSRQRILHKEKGKVKTIPIEGSESLISITSDKDRLYLLDQREHGYYILFIDAFFTKMKEIPCPGRKPSDIVYYNNALWIYDISSRSVHKYNLKSNDVDYTIYTGADNSYSKGIVFFNDYLYVHNRRTSSLDLVEFKETQDAVLSLPHTISYQYTIDCRNIDKTRACNAAFRIPVPRDSPEQHIETLEWQPVPEEIKADVYDQPLAYFQQIIKPGEHFLLYYRADVTVRAVCYKVKETPLASLAGIPEQIKEMYLGNDSYFDMEKPEIKTAAAKARLNRRGKEPSGVKELLENIVDFIINTLSYTMDNTWEKAGAILGKKAGSCSEYSFLFSALARLNNIPTRMAGGFIFERANDSFHRWTEVYYPGLGWIPVDVTAIDADDPDSLDYEFLFGKPYTRFVFSLMGGIDDTALDVEYYGYKRFSGGKRERTITVKTLSIEPVYKSTTIVRDIKAP
ncbi:MAG: transglutaminase domain-containing protein [Spirochaetales bacterium]|nr:transglutaminase domain-containing protein [Spirochaetales bacterium]